MFKFNEHNNKNLFLKYINLKNLKTNTESQILYL